MKIIITEEQLEGIKDYSKKKKFFFKFWEKYPKINQDFRDFFYIDKYERVINEKLFNEYFREFLGGDEVAIEKAIDILKKSPNKVECGAYDFNIFFDNISVNDFETVRFDITIDDENGSVVLMNVENEILNLGDALNNEDYGVDFEVQVNECIYEYLEKNLTEITGIKYVINSIDVTSQNTL